MKKKNIILLIVLVALFAVTVVCFFVLKPKQTNNKTGVESNLQTNTPVEGVSWSNAIWLSTYDKNNIQVIEVSDTTPGAMTTSWSYDGVTIGFTDNTVYLYTKKPIVVLSAERMFADMPNLTQITGMENFDFSKCKNFKSMFQGCSKLSDLDLSFNSFESAENMSYMFAECPQLNQFKINNIELNKVTNISYMFDGCVSLSVINMPDTPNVVNGERMFCGVGQSVDGGTKFNGTFNLPNCSNYNEMFMSTCFNSYQFIESMDVSNMTTAQGMFIQCAAKSLDLSRWNVSKLQTAEKMFCNIPYAKIINLNGWDCSSLTTCQSMFEIASGTHEIILNWKNTEKIKNLNSMFESCCSLKKIDLTCFNDLQVDNADQMFLCDEWLTEIKCSGITADSSVEMFSHCPKLQGAITFDESKINANMANTQGYFIN